jgi:hypothetical protein
MEIKSAFKRATLLFLTGVAALLFQAAVVQPAFAHSLTVTATASCSNGVAVINYTATSWDQNPADPGGTNPEIDILFNGVQVDAQPFLSNTTPADQFSGVQSAPPGTNTVDVEAVAAQLWGDGYASGQTSTVTVTIPTDCAPGTGRFTGGGKQVTVNLVNGDPVVVTKGFEVDCDLHQPSNNLEINWAGNQFHMTSFNAAVCTLVKKPNPPTAPVNTIVGMGTGRYDGTDGYTVIFELIDNGEPGTQDEISFKVYQTSNPSNVVLQIPLTFITGGNVQAHVDQK